MVEVPCFGYTIRPFLDAHNLAYDHQDQLIIQRTEENDKIVDELDQIKNLLASVNKDRRKNQIVDYSSDDNKKIWSIASNGSILI